ncbi:amidase family protein [Pseudonocardia sp. DR1-2]|uniref:amidase n=1 Tax=Pseudonocardia sp. DR1-2 TaxID=2951168 RepID=UPI00204331B3|nr:amidase family protein [Pseudonocardia sp. DR1-2]MCM3846754.1 amidase family protein [Pseudonocardia sp. DR1-2]
MTSTANPITDLSLADLAGLLRRRELSAREALDAHLDRIARVDPAINAICVLEPDAARRAAVAADERAASGAELPPLHGVPMTHKDTHDVAGMRSTAGCPVFADRVPDRDSPVVARLRAAGVVSTGKSNVPELGAGSHTFNPLFGTTTNPWDPTRSAGGSSGGVAAAVAAGIQAAGDASDMGGSIRTPASFCGLVGLRPSAGVVPLGAADPWAWISRKGAIARTVDDVRLMMSVLAAPGPLAAAPARPVPAGVAAGDLRGLRIGWSPDLGVGLPVEPGLVEVVARRVRALERLGAVVEPAGPDLGDADEVFATTRAHDFATSYAELHAEHGDRLKPALRANIARGRQLTADDLRSAHRARVRLLAATTAFFGRYDLLVAPAVQVRPFDAALEHPVEIDGRPLSGYLDWMRAATLVSATGLPAMSVPAGLDEGGLPVGLQLVGPDGGDDLLLAVAAALETAEPWTARPPLWTAHR